LKTLRWVLLLLTAVGLMMAPLAQPGAAADKKTASKKTADKKTAADTKLVDINTASAEELDALPGIGKVRGAAIIKGRPYANKTQLVSKGILTQSVYDKIADKIIAKQK
jgi:competence protein ComEA